MTAEWTLDTDTTFRRDGSEIQFRKWSRGEAGEQTWIRHRPGELFVSGPDAAAATEFVRDEGIGTEIPTRDGLLDLVDAAGEDARVWEVGRRDRVLDADDRTGYVSAMTDELGVTATAFVGNGGSAREVRFAPSAAQPRVAKAAGMDLDRRVTTHEIGPGGTPATFGEAAEGAHVTCQTAAYARETAEGREDVLVAGDPRAVSDLDSGSELVVRPWPAESVDLGAVDGATDAAVVALDERDLPETGVDEYLGERAREAVNGERRIVEEIPTPDVSVDSTRKHGR